MVFLRGNVTYILELRVSDAGHLGNRLEVDEASGFGARHEVYEVDVDLS